MLGDEVPVPWGFFVKVFSWSNSVAVCVRMAEKQAGATKRDLCRSNVAKDLVRWSCEQPKEKDRFCKELSQCW